ncbi:GntR family transcriptional regulator [Phreatobacter sp. AB_2022a]|uniref:GntR family transcriptional regulator n=1 Tax=Phreatobacter sp. AB_2022a TaxID=3003134 RepID=UPI0022871F5E|nr:GntR family transcriptional regulator [Phreatobacter sp. AB_2022a]MCZ0733818.1 GntR family transcriptional regulator [Phreatobacter sp. AB_2022a]
MRKSAARDAKSKFPQPEESMAAKAHRLLEEMIVTLELPPGSRWSEDALADHIGLGRTPVREAVKRLQSDTLIKVLPRHGLMVAEIDLPQQLLVIDIRKELEVFVSVRAARRATKSQREMLVTMAAAMEAAGRSDVIVYLRQLYHINRFIAGMAGNPFAEKAISPLHALSRRFYFNYHSDLMNLAEVGELHARRAKAVADADEEAARRTCLELMAVIEDYTRAIFTRSLGVGAV